MADYDKSTFDPKAAAEARKAEMDEITTKLEKGVKDIFTTEGYKDYLNFCAKLPRYSVNNQILIMLQKPDATMCQSYTGWKEMNRFVKKGEKGIRILAPAPYKMQKEQDKTDASGKTVLDKDGEPVKETVEITVNAFKPVSTFDVSQTEGEPVPTIGVNELTGSVEGYETLLAAIREIIPVPVSFEQIDSGAKGFYHLEENRIVVQEGMSEAQTVKTLLHEASHEALHSKEVKYKTGENKTRNQKETEAESVAYVVCQHYGIDTSDYSFAYVATWSQDKEVPELKASLDTIRRTASEMIMQIDTKVLELTASKEVTMLPEHSGDEIPFDSPEADLPLGFVKVEPPVPISDFKMDRKITVTMGEPIENGTQEPEKGENEKSKAKDPDKTPEKTGEKKEKKSSIKEKIAKGKEKTKANSTKKDPKKDLQKAI